MHAYIRFPGLQSKTCSSYSPLLVWGCSGDSSLFWFVWFLEADGVARFFVALLVGIFFPGFRGGVWLAGLGFFWLIFGLGFFVLFLFAFCCFLFGWGFFGWFAIVFQCITYMQVCTWNEQQVYSLPSCDYFYKCACICT